jgi:hypothetical protein
MRMLGECPRAARADPSFGPPNGSDYRSLAAQIRQIARRTRLPGARKELAELAARCDRRADHLERCGR